MNTLREYVQQLIRGAQANPLLIGVVALGAGLGIGLSLPSTRREDALLGGTRKRLLERARFFYDDAEDQAREIDPNAREEQKPKGS